MKIKYEDIKSDKMPLPLDTQKINSHLTATN